MPEIKANKKMNRKAQLDKIFTIAIAIILISIIMGIYIFLSFGARGPKTMKISSPENLLLKEMEVKIGEKTEKMLVIRAVIGYQKGEIDRENLKEGLQILVNERNSCLGLAQGESENPSEELGGKERDNFFIKFEDGIGRASNPGYAHAGLADYRNKGLHSINFAIDENAKEKKIYLEYYYGECL